MWIATRNTPRRCMVSEVVRIVGLPAAIPNINPSELYDLLALFVVRPNIEITVRIPTSSLICGCEFESPYAVPKLANSNTAQLVY